MGIRRLGLIMMFGCWLEVEDGSCVIQGRGVKRNVCFEFGWWVFRMLVDESQEYRREWKSRLRQAR